MAKSLKEQNRWKIWIIIAVNFLFLSAVVQSNTIKTEGLIAIVRDIGNLLPVGLAFIISTIFNGLISADIKAKFVFLRWNNVLPGHRAFTEYGNADPRIDLLKLKEINSSSLPIDPKVDPFVKTFFREN